MKKFIFKTLVFLAVWLVVIWGALYFLPLNYSGYTYVVSENVMSYMKSGKPAKYVTVGDSRIMAGVQPNVMKKEDFYNLSLGGATPVEGYFTVKKLIENKMQPEVLVLSYAPFHLTIHDTYPRPVGDGLLTADEISELYDVVEKNGNEVFWETDKLSVSDYSWVNRFKAYSVKFKNPMFYNAELRNSLLMRYRKNAQLQKKVKKDKGFHSYSNHKFSDQLNRETRSEHFEPKKVLVSYLRATFELARKNNLQVIYLAAPFNEASFNSVNKQYVAEYNALFERLKREYPEVVFYSDINAYPNDLFTDASHLNHDGTVRFSHKIEDLVTEYRKK